MTLKVIQGRRKWRHSINQCHISFLLAICTSTMSLSHRTVKIHRYRVQSMHDIFQVMMSNVTFNQNE